MSLRPPDGGHGEHGRTAVRLKEIPVAAAIVAVRDWFIEQVTAIQDVARPVHHGARPTR